MKIIIFTELAEKCCDNYKAFSLIWWDKMFLQIFTISSVGAYNVGLLFATGVTNYLQGFRGINL